MIKQLSVIDGVQISMINMTSQKSGRRDFVLKKHV